MQRNTGLFLHEIPGFCIEFIAGLFKHMCLVYVFV